MKIVSMERSLSFEAWEEVERHGLDLADRLAQGFTGLIQTHMNPPQFAWSNPSKSKLFDFEFPFQNFGYGDFELGSPENEVSAIFDIENRIGQAGADFDANLNGLVHQLFRSLPVAVPFMPEDVVMVSIRMEGDNKGRKRNGGGVVVQESLGLGSLSEMLNNPGFVESNSVGAGGIADEGVGATTTFTFDFNRLAPR